MFGSKAGTGVQGSYYITREAQRLLLAAVKRTGKSRSNVIDYCLRRSAAGLTRAEAEALSGEDSSGVVERARAIPPALP